MMRYFCEIHGYISNPRVCSKCAADKDARIEQLKATLRTMPPILGHFATFCQVDHAGFCHSHLAGKHKPCPVSVARTAVCGALLWSMPIAATACHPSTLEMLERIRQATKNLRSGGFNNWEIADELEEACNEAELLAGKEQSHE